MQDFASSGILTWVYAGIVFISFLFALLSLIGAGIDQVIDFDFDADGDGPFDFIGISPFALAAFGSAFGLTGLITHLWLDYSAVRSILTSTIIGLVLGVGAQLVFLYVLSPSKSSHFSLEEDALGREVEVTITIPQGGLGQVTYNNVSGRVNLGARSIDGSTIQSGELVNIEKIVGRIAYVRQAGSEQ